MPIRFYCQACDARMKVPDGSQGRKSKCPRCGFLQQVPDSSEIEDRSDRQRREELGASGYDRVGVPSNHASGEHDPPESSHDPGPPPQTPNRESMNEPDEATSRSASTNHPASSVTVLLVCTWVMRVASVVLVGGAVKLMLVMRNQGSSVVESFLYLIAGLAGCAALWTLGEIAAAVRDLGRKGHDG